jgi:TrmH family RNA methyltransferase
MDILIFSDTHGRADRVEELMRRTKASIVLFLGDGLRDLNVLRDDVTLRSVRGNCDFIGADIPEKRVESFASLLALAQGEVYAVPEHVLAAISQVKTPQGIAAVCALPDARELADMGDKLILLENVQDPGNVGTILRTADAFSADGLLLVNGCADLYNPKTVRATMGAVFRCPVWNCDVSVLRELLTASGLPLYGAALRKDTVDARSVDYSRCAIAIGSEGKGLCAQMLDICDRTVLIPMQAHCESLNAAIAATVLLWEAARND